MNGNNSGVVVIPSNTYRRGPRMLCLSPGLRTPSHSLFSCDQAALRTLQSVCLSVCLSLVCLSHLFSCHQAALCMVFSVCLSVRLSVTPISLCFHHRIILKFILSYYWWQMWCPYKRTRSEVKGQGCRGHDPTLPFLDCNSSLNSYMAMKWCTSLDVT